MNNFHLKISRFTVITLAICGSCVLKVTSFVNFTIFVVFVIEPWQSTKNMYTHRYYCMKFQCTCLIRCAQATGLQAPVFEIALVSASVSVCLCVSTPKSINHQWCGIGWYRLCVIGFFCFLVALYDTNHSYNGWVWP